MGKPNSRRLSTLNSLAEASVPNASLILSYLMGVGIGILQPRKLNLPEALTALCALIKSTASHLTPQLPPDIQDV